MLKSKILKVALVVTLLFSAFNLVQMIEAKTDINAIWRTSVGGNKVVITAFFKNEGNVGLYGTPTAEVEAITRTYTNTAERTYFPPNEQVDLTITISGIIPVDYQHLAGLQYVTIILTLPYHPYYFPVLFVSEWMLWTLPRTMSGYFARFG